MPHIITCPTGLTGSIRSLKVREVRFLADRKLAKTGSVVDELLRACWEETDDAGPYDFHFLPALTPADIHWVCSTVAKSICSLLRRRGLLRDRADDNDGAVRLAPSTALDACRQAALSRGRFERLDAKGRAQQQLFPDEPTFSRSKKSPWAVEVDGFSVEAGVHFGALDRKGREKLLRYFLRPPIATERFSRLRDGSVAYRTRVRPWLQDPSHHAADGRAMFTNPSIRARPSEA